MKKKSKILCSLTVCIGLIVVGCFGQWSNNFDNGSLNDWTGDVSDFTINDNNQLQLNAPTAGEAFIYRSSAIDFDTVSISLFHLMDFSPSDNNQSRIYLSLNDINIATASGYFIEIGENGSADALNFYFLDNGNEIFIGSATMGAMASEPAQVKLQIDIYPDGLWTVKSNYDGGDFVSLETEFIDSQFSFKESQYFGLSCKFSASRADKFFYDDLSVEKFVPDTSPPMIVDAIPQNQNELLVIFSEPILEVEATNTANYNLSNGYGNPSMIAQSGTLGNEYILTFDQDFDASLIFLLDISNVEDLNGNKLDKQTVSFLFADSPSPGDIFISEILFDPYPGGEDFVELYNRSGKYLDLNGLVIRNDQNEASKEVGSITMPPGTYLALTEDVGFLEQEYKPVSEANIEFQELPAFNNDMGNVTLTSSASEIIDSYTYSEDQHFQLIDDTEGVSLERVSFDISADEERNWQSAAENVRFATPGYKNSSNVSIAIGELNFEIQKETFSPNQDGENDQMILTYNLDKSGFLANISVYDAAGFKIKDLSTNELLANQGIITWDGTTNDNQIADLGIYIIVGNVFHPDGESKNFKLTTVLADFID